MSNMPAATASQTVLPQLPSFMSVFGDDTTMTGTMGQATAESQPPHRAASIPAHSKLPLSSIGHEHQYQIQYQHRGSTSTSTSASTSTSTSDSTDSSPTTTVSTVDSSSMTEPSPSSSPESPVSIVPLSSFALRNSGGHALDESILSPPASPFSSYNQPFSPGKRARNTKNLSLNMTGPTRPAPRPPLRVMTATGPDTSLPQSAPPSPSFIMPVRPPRKRSSNLGLTIQTPSNSTSPDEHAKGLRIVPPTPSLKLANTLRHHQSSPSLSLFSPSAGVQGGMNLPAFNPQTCHRPRQTPIPSRNSSIDSIPSLSEHLSPVQSTRLDELEEEEDDYEVPLSQEVKSPAYPAGPICIYDPNVYLYLEPNDLEASEFDVVFNVAREVKNPFLKKPKTEDKQVEKVAPVVGDIILNDARDDIREPQSAVSGDSFDTAPEELPSPDTTSPTTPKAHAQRTLPEYIHVPWDHNTNIVDDLLNLVEVIDDRVRQGKRVLVHCQCGVSRSASLIVAYGLYRNSSLTVQEAYDAVKKRSKWIGPNMSLIYQLSEFRTKLLQKIGAAQSIVRTWRTGGSVPVINGGTMPAFSGSARANTIPTSSPIKRPSLSLETFDSPLSEPLTAPLPEERDRTPNCTSPMSPLTRDAEGLGPMSPGPSSAPPNISLMPTADSPNLPRGPRTDGGEISPAPVFPARARTDDETSPRQIGGFSSLVVEDDTPPTPSLMSPRAIEFTANPFHHNAAAAMASSFGFHAGPPMSGSTTSSATITDPRSPVQRGEAPIVRSIFDVL